MASMENGQGFSAGCTYALYAAPANQTMLIIHLVLQCNSNSLYRFKLSWELFMRYSCLIDTATTLIQAQSAAIADNLQLY